MKKKLLSWLLVLCAALTALPLFTAPAAAATASYNDLYVQEGLQLFLTAFDPTDASIDLSGGTWASKKGGTVATLGGAWRSAGESGIRFDLDKVDEKSGIHLPISALPKANYTLEIVGKAVGLTQNADGVNPILVTNLYATQITSFVLGPLKGEGFPTERDPEYSHYGYYALEKQADGSYAKVFHYVTEEDVKSNKEYIKSVDGGVETMGKVADAYTYAHGGNAYSFNQLRYYYSEGTLDWENSGQKYGWGVGLNENSWRHTGEVVSYTVTHSLSDRRSSYAILKNMASVGGVNIPNGKFVYQPITDDMEFKLFCSMPATVYAVRVYDRVLSAEEQQQNHFADIMAYHRLPLSILDGKSPDEKKMMHSAFTNMAVDTDRATVETLLNSFVSTGGTLDKDTLYVTNGLTVLLTTFGSGEDTIQKHSGFSLWKNQVDGSNKTLMGDVWQRQPDGSLGYRQTLAQWNDSQGNGLILPFSDLPEGDFTVETVANPVGLTNEDGSRYVDDVTKYGTYLDYGFCFGPLKAMTFVCMRPIGKDGQMEHRWVYIKNGCWAAANCVAAIMDRSWEDTDGQTPVTFTVTHDMERSPNGKPSSEYKIWDNYLMYAGKVLDGPNWIARNDADNMFQLMVGQPGDLYAVRVYDRVLSETEMLQNHTADLIYFYGLNPALLQQALRLTPRAYDVYKQFRDISFDLTKEEAALAYETALGSIWMTYDGMAVRLDAGGVRSEFTLNLDAVAAMEEMGYRFEVYVLVNLQTAGTPTLDQNDHCFCVYKDGQKTEDLFVDGNTFAAAVFYTNSTTKMYLQELALSAHLIMTDPQGEKTVIQHDATAPGDAMNAFSLYSHMLTTQNYVGNAWINRLVDSCYTKMEFHVSPQGSNAARGTEDAPLATLAEAYVRLVDILSKATLPIDVRLRLHEGVHRLTDPLVLNGKDFPMPYRITLEGSDAATTTLTSNLALNSTDFVKDPTTGIYTYQMASDANGNYPDFRFLYVNGKLATRAHTGETRAFGSGRKYYTAVDQKYDALTGEYTAANKRYFSKALFEGLSDSDIAQLELHIERQWEFSVLKITRVDRSDTYRTEDGEETVAVYFNADPYMHSSNSWLGRQYWLENARSFVDEPGEFYYNSTTGMLYYLPEEGTVMAESSVEIPTLNNLLVFRNVHGLTVQNLTFTGADDRYLNQWGHQGGQAGGQLLMEGISGIPGEQFPDRAAIFVENTDRMTVSYCIFTDLGCEGISMRGRLENVTVEGNRFLTIGATALRMADGSELWDASHGLLNTYICENEFNNIAFSIRQCSATQFASCRNFVMEYNTLRNCSYSAISIGWSWSNAAWQYGERVNLDHVRISENYITDFMTDQKDGGAIYTLGGNATGEYTEHFNHLTNNLIVFSEKTGCGGMVCGIYHDGSSSHWRDSSNIIVEASAKNLAQSSKHEYYRYIYIQHIDAQEAYNILEEENIIVNVRATLPEEQLAEVYREYLTVKDANTIRNIHERNTVYITGDRLSSLGSHDAAGIIAAVGSSFAPPELESLLSNDY